MPLTAAAAVLLAAALPLAGAPPLPPAEVAVSSWASATVEPSGPDAWGAQVSVGEEIVGRERRVVADVMLTRRSCDVAGCIETVLRTQPSHVEVAFAPGLGAAIATGAQVAVMVRRHSLDGSTATIIEDRTITLPLVVRLRSTGGELRSWFRSIGGGSRTVTRSLQVAATARITLGSVRLSTTQASASRSRRVTMPWPEPTR